MSVVNLPPPAPGRLGFARKADVDLFVEKLEAFETGALSADDWRGFRLLNGVYGQRQDGVMMIRAKLPGGFVTPAQLEALAVVSGHAESAYAPILDGIAPGALTLVVLMGVRTRGPLAARLIARGWSPATPAAILHGASHPESFTWLGDLASLGEAVFETELPGVLVIGEVVSLAHQIAAAPAHPAVAERYL